MINNTHYSRIELGEERWSDEADFCLTCPKSSGQDEDTNILSTPQILISKCFDLIGWKLPRRQNSTKRHCVCSSIQILKNFFIQKAIQKQSLSYCLCVYIFLNVVLDLKEVVKYA